MEREIRNEAYANPAARPDDEMDYKFAEEIQAARQLLPTMLLFRANLEMYHQPYSKAKLCTKVF